MGINPLGILKNNRRIFSNFSWLAILEIFGLLAPLITYPYLVKVLGTELYGWVITGQVTSAYASILIDFGFRRVSAKYVAAAVGNYFEMSRIVSTVIVLRLILWMIAFLLYMGVILLVPSYRCQWVLFLLSYGLTFSTALLPDFYFQGIEKLKYITIINIFIRLVFVGSTYIFIKNESQYLFVPLIWSIGYLLGGIYSIYIIYKNHGLAFIKPKILDYKFHLKETSPIFLSDVMLNIKDKFSYNLMGSMLGMSNVVVYDIGTKIVNILSRPTAILSTAIFPSMSKNPDVVKTKKIMFFLFLTSVILVSICYVILPQLIKFFLHEEIDLLPLRIYLLVPIFTGLSYYIPSSVFVVFGYNSYVLYSTIFSCISYIILLSVMWLNGWLTSVFNFILLTVCSYFIETVFRLFLSHRIFKEHRSVHIQ